MKTVLFYLIQFTWGALQNIIGFIAFIVCGLFFGNFRPMYKRSFVCEIPKIKGNISLGCFILVNDYLNKQILKHEYGHTIQSLILGVFYIFVIGIPSLIWAACHKTILKGKNIDYYSFYTEKWANKLVEE